MQILSFDVTKDVLMIDVVVTVSETGSVSGGVVAPSATDVLKSLKISGGSVEEEKNGSEEKVAGADSTVVNPWTVESEGAIDYLR